jgi:HK97 family phage portal protein
LSQAEKADAGSVFGFIGGAFSNGVDSAINDAEAAYWFVNNHPWVGSAVGLIASAIHADGYNILNPSVEADQDTVNRDPRTVALRTLFDNINEEQTLMDLVEEISMDMDGPGRAYAHKLRLPNGNCVGLERIDPRTMAPVLSADKTRIAKFVQKIKVNGIIKATDFKAEDIIYFKRPGGSDLLGGQSLIQQLDLTLAVDFGSRKSNAARYANGPRSGMVLMFKTLSKPDSEKLEKNVLDRAGATNAHKPMVLTGDGTVTFPKSDTDEEYTKALDRSRQEVCAVYHVPESKLMTTEGSLGGNGKEQDDQTFHEECVMPRCKRIFATLTRELLRKEYKITDLIISPKSKYAIRVSAIEDATKMLQAGGSINEARDLIGLPKSASKADLDAPCYPTTITTAKDPADKVQMALPLDPNQAPIETDPDLAKKGVAKSGTKGQVLY